MSDLTTFQPEELTEARAYFRDQVETGRMATGAFVCAVNVIVHAEQTSLALADALSALSRSDERVKELEGGCIFALKTLAFAESVIKSGEPWTKTCEQLFSEARQALSKEAAPGEKP